jgi:hypothetical protein
MKNQAFQLRSGHTKSGHPWLLTVAVLVLGIMFHAQTSAESALDLISGFDAQRLVRTHPVDDYDAAGEMARLLFRLRKGDGNVIASRVGPLTDQTVAGDVVEIQGTISAIRQYKVPESLIEFLDLETFHEVVLSFEQDDESISVFAPPLLGKVAKGDSIRADAIVLNLESSQGVFAAGNLVWTPARADSVGWKLLAGQGVDLSRVAAAETRNRRPLEAADADAFYSMLAAAKEIEAENIAAANGDEPQVVDPVQLLENPQDYGGQWIRLNASTVRITRVNVTDPVRRQQLGQDHYFQIDSSGDLGKTIIRLERPQGDPGEPVLMSGSYPVSMVACDLPGFLQEHLEDKDAVVAMVSHPISIDGFFYRLWSYENEFMKREGAGKQVGPLVVVSSWRSRDRASAGGEDLQVIGYALAVGIIAAILGTIIWTRRNAKQDAKIRERNQQATRIEL